MEAVETDMLCGSLSLADGGEGLSSFLTWADDVLDGVTDSVENAFCQQSGGKRCFLRLDIGPADMLQADCLPVMVCPEHPPVPAAPPGPCRSRPRDAVGGNLAARGPPRRPPLEAAV